MHIRICSASQFQKVSPLLRLLLKYVGLRKIIRWVLVCDSLFIEKNECFQVYASMCLGRVFRKKNDACSLLLGSLIEEHVSFPEVPKETMKAPMGFKQYAAKWEQTFAHVCFLWVSFYIFGLGSLPHLLEYVPRVGISDTPDPWE